MRDEPSQTVDCPPQAWSWPPETLLLGTDDVHVWRASLNSSAVSIEKSSQILSTDEMARADRFYFDLDRNHFIVARAWLRIIIGSYLKVDPAELKFDYSIYGKPALAKPFIETTGLDFNLAHSGELALYGITLRRKIGVDLEQIRPDFVFDGIARRCFTTDERAQISSLSNAARPRAFFEYWTRKEAFVKAKGVGVSFALNQFEVTVRSNEAALLLTQWDPAEVDRWSLHAVDVHPDYAAALVLEGSDLQLSRWEAAERMLRKSSFNHSAKFSR
jgi:4'-phosphopantetheinyl transferase